MSIEESFFSHVCHIKRVLTCTALRATIIVNEERLMCRYLFLMCRACSFSIFVATLILHDSYRAKHGVCALPNTLSKKVKISLCLVSSALCCR